MLWAIAWASVLMAMLVVDLGWLYAMRRFYRASLGPHLAPRTNWAAALIFYALFAAGVVFFVVAPTSGDGMRGRQLAALRSPYHILPMISTNQATFSELAPLRLTPVDMAWGTALATLLGVVGRVAVRWL
ncbi:MAG: DUF2177 family protein [Rhodospirillaceae bacterium]|nr:DUF2177 family protein [Rhodospirillaceae bacterium]